MECYETMVKKRINVMFPSQAPLLSKVEIWMRNITTECCRDVNRLFVGIDCSVGCAHDAIMVHVGR